MAGEAEASSAGVPTRPGITSQKLIETMSPGTASKPVPNRSHPIGKISPCLKKSCESRRCGTLR